MFNISAAGRHNIDTSVIYARYVPEIKDTFFSWASLWHRVLVSSARSSLRYGVPLLQYTGPQ